MKLLLLLFGAILVNGRKLYTGHQVWRLVPINSEQTAFLHALREQEYELDFWTEVRAPGYAVDINVPPNEMDRLSMMLEDQDIDYHVMIQDLDRAIEVNIQQDGGKEIFDRYLPFDEMMTWVEDKAAQCGSRCEIIDIGSSHEGNVIKVIKITDGSGSPKPRAWIDAGIHAREWISHAVNLYFIERMIDDFASDSDVQAMLSTYDWYFLPCLNPDGYIYSWDTDRMWRKTRRPNDGSACVGADANRNFDHNFGGVGTSSNPCDNTFHGGFAYSQPCTKAVSEFIENVLISDLDIFVTLHSYSQLWMAPWGYTTEPPPNYVELIRAGNAAADALRSVYGTNYQVGSASEILYASSGTSRDWAYGVPAIRWVYTIELRDQGNYGFVLPPAQIRPSGVETWAAIRALYHDINSSKLVNF